MMAQTLAIPKYPPLSIGEATQTLQSYRNQNLKDIYNHSKKLHLTWRKCNIYYLNSHQNSFDIKKNLLFLDIFKILNQIHQE